MRISLSVLCLMIAVAPAAAAPWGPGSFENRSALEWKDRLVEEGTPGDVFDVLERALDVDRVGEGLGAEAIAAAEVVAALLGHPSPELPPDLRHWVRESRLRATRAQSRLASRAVDRVRGRADSDLHEFWNVLDASDWESSVVDVLRRLQMGPVGPRRAAAPQVEMQPRP